MANRNANPAGMTPETAEEKIARLEAENAALRASGGHTPKPRVFVKKDNSIGYGVSVGFPSSLSAAAAEAILADPESLRTALAEAQRMASDKDVVAKVRKDATERAARKAGK